MHPFGYMSCQQPTPAFPVGGLLLPPSKAVPAWARAWENRRRPTCPGPHNIGRRPQAACGQESPFVQQWLGAQPGTNLGPTSAAAAAAAATVAAAATTTTVAAAAAATATGAAAAAAATATAATAAAAATATTAATAADCLSPRHQEPGQGGKGKGAIPACSSAWSARQWQPKGGTPAYGSRRSAGTSLLKVKVL